MSDVKTPEEIVDLIKPFLSSEPQLDKMKDDIKSYGRKKKISGAISFAKLVKKMRDKQQNYFRNNKSNYQYAQQLLKESKKLEEQVDRAVEAILK